MTHFELCKKTAERFVSSVALFEVSMLEILEKLDVLDFNSSGRSTLYEIKMSRSDFLADRKKYSRAVNPWFGEKRYFVCYGDFIKENEVPQGWGLYHFKNGKFYKIKESDNFFITESEREDMWKHNTYLLLNQIICEKENIVFHKRILENREKFRKLKENKKHES